MMLTIELPLPPRALGPNGSRGHWSKTASARHEYRQQVALLVASAVRELRWSAPASACLSVTYGVKRLHPQLRSDRYHPIDLDNALAAFKAGIDGLVDGGALVGDHAGVLSLRQVQITRQDGPWVRVTVEAGGE